MKIGSKIKVIKYPDKVNQLPKESQDLFKKCLGKEYIVDDLDNHGQLWVKVDIDGNPAEGFDIYQYIAFEPDEVELIKE